MQGQLLFRQRPALSLSPDVRAPVRAGLAVGAAVSLAIYLGVSIAFLKALPASGFEVDLPADGGPIAVDEPLILQTVGLGTSVVDLRLTELELNPEGQVVSRRAVAVNYRPVTEGHLPGETRGMLVRADGSLLLGLDARYELTVRGEGKELSWQGLRSVPLLAERTFSTPLTPRPQLEDDVVLAVGEPLELGWNVPITEFHYRVRPEVETHSWLGADGQTAYIALDEFQQGARYEIEVTDARATTGAPLLQPATGVFTTPSPLRVTGFTPENSARDVAPGLDPILTFNAPITNPELAEDVILVEPPVDGTFRWLAPNRVQFATDKGFPYSSNIRLTVQPGPDSLRSIDGGYLEDEVTLAYRTRVNKRIDVDLTRQLVTLLEDGRVVYITAASTGVRGAETPPGTFTIQYKMGKARFRGTNPSGRTYDIPDVPWVMAIFGDYTFHGAPWRQAFGVPLSNGCVSLPAPAAKYIYDWTPVGTPVTIHY